MEEVMPHDEGLGIAGMERFEEHAERQALRWSAGVGGSVPTVQASHIADANGMEIVILAMRTDLRLGAATLNSAVEPDQVVVSNPFPASLAVPLIHLRQGDLPPGGCGGTMNDEQRDRATRHDGILSHNNKL